MNKQSRIFPVAGHRGMVGSALVGRLVAAGYTNVDHAHAARARSAGSGRCDTVFSRPPRRSTSAQLSAARERRHFCERVAAGRVHL